MTRIKLKIDRITADAASLDRAALERALRNEVARVMATDGFAAAEGGYRPQVRAALPMGQGGLADRVAGATVRAVKV